MKRLSLIFVIALCLWSGLAFGSAANIQVTQSGSTSGNCTGGAVTILTPTQFNTSSNWGAGSTQIGSGTTVLLCGVFTSSVQGGNALTTKGDGTNSSPITIICDTTCTFESTGWWGATQQWSCGSCSGAISVLNQYIILDGNNTGIIENMLAGNPGSASPGAATCLSGPCTQTPGNTGSAGIYVAANNVIVRNWTIQDLYNNFGSNTGNSDGGNGGQYTSDIWECCQGTVANLEIYNNTLANSRAGLTLGVGGTTGPNNCPTTSSTFAAFSGTCLHQNTLTDHAWHMNSVQLAGTYLNFYNNSVSGYANWFWPNPGGSNPSSNPYHLDGIIDWGVAGLGTMYIYNNFFSGDQAGPISGAYGDSTGFIYCSNTEGGPPGDGSGSSCYIFNNVLEGTGAGATSTNMMDLSIGGCGSSPGYPAGPYYLYNNTFSGTAHQMFIFWGNGCSSPYAAQFHGANNLFLLSSNTDTGPFGGGTYFLEQDNTVPFSALVSWDYNDYYNSASSPVTNWNWDTGTFTSLASWRTGSGVDAHSQVAAPLLNTNFTPQSGSPLINAGATWSGAPTAWLTGPPLTFGVGGACGTGGCVARPASGAQTEGAYPFQASVSNASLTPSATNFTNQAVGMTSSGQTVTLNNSGGSTLNIASFVVTGAYAQTNTCGSTVAADGSCTITVTFTPTLQGTESGVLTVTDDNGGVSGSVQTAVFSGAGTASNCGPPSYSCLVSSDANIPLVTPIPIWGTQTCNMSTPYTAQNCGSLTGAGTIRTPADFGLEMSRCTDMNSVSFVGTTHYWLTVDNGEPNIFAADDSALVLKASGEYFYIFAFNPTTMACAYTGISYTNTSVIFDHTSPTTIYIFGLGTTGTQLYQDTLPSNLFACAPSCAQPSGGNHVLLYDYLNSNCLQNSYNGYTASWTGNYDTGEFTDSLDDQKFIMEFSSPVDASQAGTLLARWEKPYGSSGGCDLIRTSGPSPSTSPLMWTYNGGELVTDTTDLWNMHEAFTSKGGDFAVTSANAYLGSTPTTEGYWFVGMGTTAVNRCPTSGVQPPYCEGHAGEGYLNESVGQNILFHSYLNANETSGQTALVQQFPYSPEPCGDTHTSWNNDNVLDTAAVLLKATTVGSVGTPSTPYGNFYNGGAVPCAFFNEVFLTLPTTNYPTQASGVVARAAHCYNTGWNQNFDTQNCISVISHTGRFAVITTDGMGQFGPQGWTSGSAACNIGGPDWQASDSTDFTSTVGGTWNYILPLTNNPGYYIFQVSASSACAGGTCTTASTRPTFPQTGAATVADGTGATQITWANTGQQGNCRTEDIVIRLGSPTTVSTPLSAPIPKMITGSPIGNGVLHLKDPSPTLSGRR